jgi:hypothetical protein
MAAAAMIASSAVSLAIVQRRRRVLADQAALAGTSDIAPAEPVAEAL